MRPRRLGHPRSWGSSNSTPGLKLRTTTTAAETTATPLAATMVLLPPNRLATPLRIARAPRRRMALVAQALRAMATQRTRTAKAPGIRLHTGPALRPDTAIPNIAWVPIAPYEPFYPWYPGGVARVWMGIPFGGYAYQHFTNVTYINRIYRNFRHGGATATTFRHFRHGTVHGHTVAVDPRDIGRALRTIHGPFRSRRRAITWPSRMVSDARAVTFL